MIPIKGYATFDPLKHCWVGSGFEIGWFKDFPLGKSDKIMDPLKRIAEETEEDYQQLLKILKDANVETYRTFYKPSKQWKDWDTNYGTAHPPICPRDDHAVIGEKFYNVGKTLPRNEGIIKQINPEQIVHDDSTFFRMSTANIVRVGKDIFWDITPEHSKWENLRIQIEKYKQQWIDEGFRVHISDRGYHSDGCFCVVKPGCIVSLTEIQDYKTEFPGWDVLYIPDQSWAKVDPFMKIKNKVGERWWLKGEEHNDQLIEFVNTWLNDWVGYVEETVFDVNMLSIDQNTIICNNYNKEVFDHLKKHKVEPIIFNFRHRYFWDGGVHCITQDLYREGEQTDYFE
jgi:hypothetical protein